MTTRRKFLTQGGLAAAALIAAKPLKTAAAVGSPMSGTTNSVLLLHTAAGHEAGLQLTKQVADLRSAAGNVVLLHAGKEAGDNTAPLDYDASISQKNAVSATANNYRIIYRGQVKTGVITVTD